MSQEIVDQGFPISTRIVATNEVSREKASKDGFALKGE